MPIAADMPILQAVCYRCQREFASPEPSSCPECGGGVILELAGERGERGIPETPRTVSAPADTGDGGRSSSGFLPGVHVKLSRAERLSLAKQTQAASARRGGGTSVFRRGRRLRRERGLALRFLPFAAFFATLAVALPAVH